MLGIQRFPRGETVGTRRSRKEDLAVLLYGRLSLALWGTVSIDPHSRGHGIEEKPWPLLGLSFLSRNKGPRMSSVALIFLGG